MVFKRATLLLGAALVVGGAERAAAADLYGGSIKDAPIAYEPAPRAALGPSIYFRLDGGYSAYDDPIVTENDIFTLTEAGIDESWSVGGGVGVGLGGGFRVDLTYERRFETDVFANLGDPLNDLPGAREFGFESDVFLANVYYDFNWGGRFTPYVGIGLGFAKNKTTTGTVTNDCGCVTGEIESGSDTDVAAAFMTGVSIKLRGGQQTMMGGIKDAPVVVDSGRALYFDVGYRFLYLGDVATGAVVGTYDGVPASQDPKVEDIHAHEIRAGLRYHLN